MDGKTNTGFIGCEGSIQYVYVSAKCQCVFLVFVSLWPKPSKRPWMPGFAQKTGWRRTNTTKLRLCSWYSGVDRVQNFRRRKSRKRRVGNARKAIVRGTEDRLKRGGKQYDGNRKDGTKDGRHSHILGSAVMRNAVMLRGGVAERTQCWLEEEDSASRDYGYMKV